MGEDEDGSRRMSTHTPGPWTFDADWRRLPTIFGADKKMIAIVEKNMPHHEREANARLIAAAPDLLAAAQAQEAAELGRDDNCEECDGQGEPEACGKCFPPFDDARVMRRLAIAKATGTE